jgi:hypothetical protein
MLDLCKHGFEEFKTEIGGLHLGFRPENIFQRLKLRRCRESANTQDAQQKFSPAYMQGCSSLTFNLLMNQKYEFRINISLDITFTINENV